jgi:hypothetical protein
VDSRLFLPRNTLLDRGYRIARVVGSGGFAVTYEAEDVGLGMRVAVKEYYPVDFAHRAPDMGVRPKSERHQPTFDWGRASFLNEARTLARFEHPNIVRVARVFEANSTAYMVMRFEHGLSFERWLAGLDGPPAQAKLDRVVAPILDALEVVHAANVLHRDIAPDNIIIRPDGTPVLLDFGAARRAVDPASGALTGVIKAGYSPQEQYASDSRLQGPWSDIYALGATLYRALMGKPPEEAALRAMEDGMRPAMQLTSGDYRPGFLAAIDSCLEVDPKKRPQSVAELRPLLLGPKPASGIAAWTAAGRTSPARWLIGAAASVFLVACAYGGWEYRRAWADASAPAGVVEVVQSVAPARDEEKRAEARAEAEAKRREEAELAEKKAAEEAEAKRQAEAAKREADKLAKGAFDGEWEVVGQGGKLCRFKDWKYRISIENNRILVPKMPPGEVKPSGEFQYKYVAVGLPGAAPGVFTGSLAGDSGKGRYNYSNICLGSMTLNRL